MRCLATVILVTLFFSSRGSAQPEETRWLSQLYSQNSYDSRTRNFVTQNKVWLHLLDARAASNDGSLRFSPFIGARFDDDQLTTETEIYNENRATPVAGVLGQYLPLKIGAFAEVFRHNFQATAYHYGLWFPSTLAPRLFLETYSDLSTRQSWNGNAILAHWTKAGFRLVQKAGFEWDAYTELEFHRDRFDLPYENFRDIRAGTRVQYRLRGFVVGLSGSMDTGLYQGDVKYRTPLKSLLVIAMDASR